MAIATAPWATLQAALAERFPSATPQACYVAPEMVSAGVAAVDTLTGGLPRGSLVEICGRRCSGRTSLLLAMLAACTARGEACALVDARDSFDPHAGRAAGIALERLLWVRCARIEQSFRAAEWLLTGGGFGMVALDLGDIPTQTVRRVPLNVWFRFRRAVEHTPTVLAVLGQKANAGSCAALVLELHTEQSQWHGAATNGVDVAMRGSAAAALAHTTLLAEKRVRTEVLRSRYAKFVKRPVSIAQPRDADGRCASFALAPDLSP